uniref:Uncharacterized protein n=1 Tax=Acrobeloides nanus TaxID=290746 RepID=A0A914EDI8_9BILA
MSRVVTRPVPFSNTIRSRYIIIPRPGKHPSITSANVTAANFTAAKDTTAYVRPQMSQTQKSGRKGHKRKSSAANQCHLNV